MEVRMMQRIIGQSDPGTPLGGKLWAIAPVGRGGTPPWKTVNTTHIMGH